MIERKTVSRVIFNILNYGFMIAFAIVCIAPVWHVLMASVSNPRMLVASSGILWKPVGEITLKGYELVFRNRSLMGGYLNTLIYVAWKAIVGTIFTLVAGFLVSRKNFKLALPLLLFIMFTMMFNGGLIPTYQVQRSLGLINNKWALMIPGLMNAFYITMIKAAFDQLSPSFEESAKLDGAGPLTILFRILTPLIKPSLAVVVMFTVVMEWNSWYPASIYLPMARKDWPLQLLMREIACTEQHRQDHFRCGCRCQGGSDFQPCKILRDHCWHPAYPLCLSLCSEVFCERRHAGRRQRLSLFCGKASSREILSPIL